MLYNFILNAWDESKQAGVWGVGGVWALAANQRKELGDGFDSGALCTRPFIYTLAGSKLKLAS